jgi:hypothetical protein
LPFYASLVLSFVRSSSDPTALLLWGAGGIFVGIALFIHGFRLLQRRRLVIDTPVSKIRSAALGLVEISGQAVGPYMMIAPITTRPCYYYRTIVWEWRHRGKNSEWVQVAAECMHLPFFVDDNTGRMMVDPRGADLDLHCDFRDEFHTSVFSTRDTVLPTVSNFLARHGVATHNKIKVEEFCIKPKNALFILGTIAENPGLSLSQQPLADLSSSSTHSFSVSSNGGSLSLRADLGASIDTRNGIAENRNAESFAQRLSGSTGGQVPMRREIIRLTPDAAADPTSTSQQQKVAAALAKAGISNPAMWTDMSGARTPAQVGVNAASSVVHGSGSGAVATAETPDGFDARPPVVLGKGENNKTFLISWRSQREVARTLAWKCTLMIWGGPVLAVLGLYLLLSVEHWL